MHAKLKQLSCTLSLATLLLLAGCAEGPLWRSGKLNPWARNQWAEEARIADTLFVKKNTKKLAGV